MDKKTIKTAAYTLVAACAITVGGIMIYNKLTKEDEEKDKEHEEEMKTSRSY